MFGRKTSEEPAPTSAPEPRAPGKNRPTPKRREVEAARRQPLVPSSRTSGGRGGKGATKEARQAAREERVQARARMMAGDERYLAARDRGPDRRFVRDYVDSRWNLGELLLPVMIVVLAVSMLGSGARSDNPGLYSGILAITYAMVLMAIFDGFLLARRVSKALRQRFGAEVPLRGVTWYAVMRAFQIRRTRVPRPAVKRGQSPH